MQCDNFQKLEDRGQKLRVQPEIRVFLDLNSNYFNHSIIIAMVEYRWEADILGRSVSHHQNLEVQTPNIDILIMISSRIEHAVLLCLQPYFDPYSFYLPSCL